MSWHWPPVTRGLLHIRVDLGFPLVRLAFIGFNSSESCLSTESVVYDLFPRLSESAISDSPSFWPFPNIYRSPSPVLLLPVGSTTSIGFASRLFNWLWLQLSRSTSSTFGCSSLRRFSSSGSLVAFNFLNRFQFVLFSRSYSPPQVRHREMLYAKHARELPQFVKTKTLGEDVGSLPIRRNIL